MSVSERDLEFIEAVKAACHRGGSYNGVARELVTTPAKVRGVMEKHSPGSIRPGLFRNKGRRKDVEGFTLRALGQFNVGACEECGCPLVAYVEHRAGSQTCGLCRAYAKAVIANAV